MWHEYRPYVSVAQRQAKAARQVAKLKKKGQTITPIEIAGRAIATTFWGKAWCDHMESYSDYENRLPRGRTYVRNGSVVDLQIAAGKVTALVAGSELYRIKIEITTLAPKLWNVVKTNCAGQIGSLVELLQGRLSKSVMDIVTQRDGGLFPKPPEIKMSCSCPDWAGLCKHLAAVLYGVGARLDQQPELLFKLRKVDHLELVETVGQSTLIAKRVTRGAKTIAQNELADVFGIELADTDAPDVAAPEVSAPNKTARRRVMPKKAAAASVKLPTKAVKIPRPAKAAASRVAGAINKRRISPTTVTAATLIARKPPKRSTQPVT